jgi:hypothetical protein
LVAATVFFVFTATKQVRPVYLHAPWFNDPYDTVFSFTMFFVPLVVAAFLVQISLCRRSEPLPAGRVIMILRGCRVAIGAMVIELLSSWMAVILGANRSEWEGGATGALVALLALATLATGIAVIYLFRAPRLQSTARVEGVQSVDWLADVVTAAHRQSRVFGPFRSLGLSILDWIDRTVFGRVRRHPIGGAGVASALFSLIVFGWQAIREGYTAAATILSMGLGLCGMFAFLVLGGSYLGLVRSPKALHGGRRRALDGIVVACIAALGALAFRGSLWWTIGSSASTTGPAQFTTLVVGAALIAFLVAFAVETILRFHSKPA